MSHPFWSQVLSFPEHGPSIPDRLRDRPLPDRQRFLTLAAKAFYPISFCSALAFHRFSMLTENAQAREVAQMISEVELGLHPLLPGSHNMGVRHCDQLKRMLASLIDGVELDLPIAEHFALVQGVHFENLPLVEALAICEVIETTAPSVIHHYADFVAQWQTTYKRPTRLIDRIYLDEHNLTEGDSTSEQHICQLELMKEPHGEECRSEAYAVAQQRFHQQCYAHIEAAYQEMLPLIA